MAHNGTRKRLKVRWMQPTELGFAHAFKIGTGGTLEAYALCGLPLVAMHRWRKSEGGEKCEVCDRSMGRSFRA